MKTCNDCKETKPLDEFYRQKIGNSRQSYCKKCCGIRSKKWQQNNRQRYSYLIAKHVAEKKGQAAPDEHSYKVAPDAPDRCEICQKKTISLKMDHDHKTGKFRGWICHKCNLVLAYVDRAVNLMEYLQRGKY